VTLLKQVLARGGCPFPRVLPYLMHWGKKMFFPYDTWWICCVSYEKRKEKKVGHFEK
jgi:hypothetical protein